MTPETALAVRELHGWYGESKALHGMEFDVGRGEIVTLLGRNGAGKTTTLRAVMGLLRRKTGEIRFRDENVAGQLPEYIARRGIAYCPEERGIFASLTVQENLTLPPVIAEGGMTIEELFSLFPNLAERRNSPGTKLSGGEQQMLAIARILRTGATLLLLDEPTEGLAPVLIQQIGTAIAHLKTRGFTMLLVEQNFRFASKLADCHYVVEHGRIIDRIDAGEVAGNMEHIQNYLKV